jgi:hypothetical protein
VTESDIAATKKMLTQGTFSVEAVDAPLRLLGAVAEQARMQFVLTQHTDPAMTAASCARTADFAMGNDLLTENSLYLLASNCPAHHSKGVSLRLDLHAESCREHSKELRGKLNDLHGLKAPDSVVIVAVTQRPTELTYAIPANAAREVAADHYRELLGEKYLGHEYIPAFWRLRIDGSAFSAKWNRDFRIPANVVHEKRGGYPYNAPAGFMRYGLNVSGRFDGGNNTWLGGRNIRGEWAVAYHGICPSMDMSINGYGICCSPKVEVVTRSAASVTMDGEDYTCAFMCRVNVSSVHHCTQSPCPEARNPAFTVHIATDGDYWFVNAEKKNYQNIRTYALLVRKN